jgi:hypothetical protein
MGRWLVVRVVAWGLRRGARVEDIERGLQRTHKHRDYEWRSDVIGDALLRNARNARRKLAGR